MYQYLIALQRLAYCSLNVRIAAPMRRDDPAAYLRTQYFVTLTQPHTWYMTRKTISLFRVFIMSLYSPIRYVGIVHILYAV